MIRFGIRNLRVTAAAVLLTMPQNAKIFAQSNPCAGVSDSGIAYSNPALFEQRKTEWLACIASRPRDVLVLEQAADFVAILDPALAQDLYEQARAIEPDNSKWASKLAHLYSRNAERSADPTRDAKLALTEGERALALGASDASLAQMAFDAGDMIKARTYAEQFISAAAASHRRLEHRQPDSQGQSRSGPHRRARGQNRRCLDVPRALRPNDGFAANELLRPEHVARQRLAGGP